jgi:hypothetical protein
MREMKKSASMLSPVPPVSSFIHSHSVNFEHAADDQQVDDTCCNQKLQIMPLTHNPTAAKFKGKIASSATLPTPKTKIRPQPYSHSISSSSGDKTSSSSLTSSPSKSPTKLRAIDETISATTSPRHRLSSSINGKSNKNVPKKEPDAALSTSLCQKKKRSSLFNLFSFKIANNSIATDNCKKQNNSVSSDSVSSSLDHLKASLTKSTHQHMHLQGSATLDYHRRSPTAKKPSSKSSAS